MDLFRILFPRYLPAPNRLNFSSIVTKIRGAAAGGISHSPIRRRRRRTSLRLQNPRLDCITTNARVPPSIAPFAKDGK